MLSRQRYSNRKNGLGFYNFDKSSTSKKIIVKDISKSNNVEPKKMHVVNPLKRSNVRNDYNGKNYSNVRHNSYSRNYSNVINNSYNLNYSNNSYVRSNPYAYKNHHVHKPICFYCNTKGHTPESFYMRNYGVPYSEYIWVKKGSNQQGPKAH